MHAAKTRNALRAFISSFIEKFNSFLSKISAEESTESSSDDENFGTRVRISDNFIDRQEY